MRIVIKTLLYLVFLTMAGLWMFSHYGDRYWIADLLSNFMFQFTISSYVLMALFIATKSRIGWVISGTLGCYIAFTCFADLYTQPNVSICQDGDVLCKTEQIRVVQYNMLYDNNRVDQAILWLLEGSDADIVLLQEVDDTWKHKMRMLEMGFPYVLGAIEGFPDGIAVYSKIPLSSAAFRKGSLGSSTYARIELNTPHLQIPMVFYNMHAISPMRKSHWYVRNFNLLDVAHEAGKDTAQNRIILGDFNTTRWSKWFKKARDISGLRDAQEGHGYDISWSPLSQKLLVAGLHIDQMLVSNDIVVIERNFGPDLGSDHLPVVTTISAKKQMLETYYSRLNTKKSFCRER